VENQTKGKDSKTEEAPTGLFWNKRAFLNWENVPLKDLGGEGRMFEKNKSRTRVGEKSKRKEARSPGGPYHAPPSSRIVQPALAGNDSRRLSPRKEGGGGMRERASPLSVRDRCSMFPIKSSNGEKEGGRGGTGEKKKLRGPAKKKGGSGALKGWSPGPAH